MPTFVCEVNWVCMLVIKEGQDPVAHTGTGYRALLHFRWVEGRHLRILGKPLETVLRNPALAFLSQLRK